MSASADLGPQALQPFFNAINFMCQPVIFYTTAIIGFFGVLAARKYWVKPAAIIGILAAFLVFMGISLKSPQFYHEAIKSDNVPIWIMLFFTGLCLWAAFYQAVNNDERIKQGLKPEEAEVAEEKLHVWPYLLYIEGIVAAFALALLFIWSIGLDAPLEQFANPQKSPNPAKAPWYFLGLQELLVYYDPWIAGVVLPTMIITGLMALPYCDTNPKGVGYFTFEQRKFSISVYLFGFLMMWVLLVFVGTFLRGQNWNFFGLYEPWDEHKVISANNINVSQLFWEDLMKIFTGTPRSPDALKWYVREIPGFIIVGGYMLILPLLVKKVFKNFYNSFITTYGKIGGEARYMVIVIHLIVMLAVPIKMYLRWAFNLKYIIFIPEYFLNI